MHNSGCNSVILLVKYCAIISGSRKHWKPPVFCLTPSLPVPFSVTVSLSVCPCASAAILPSFLSLPGVLYFFASSLHQPPFSSRLLSLSPSLHVVVLLYLTPRSFPTTSILLPLLDSILFLPLPLPSSLRLSFFLSPCIMLFLIYLSHSVFCWVLKIRYSLSLFLYVLCFISSTWCHYLAFIAVPVFLSMCWCYNVHSPSKQFPHLTHWRVLLVDPLVSIFNFWWKYFFQKMQNSIFQKQTKKDF